MSKKNRVRKLFSPSTLQGFMPNEAIMEEHGLEKECVTSIMERMNITRRDAQLKFEIWSNN